MNKYYTVLTVALAIFLSVSVGCKDDDSNTNTEGPTEVTAESFEKPEVDPAEKAQSFDPEDTK